MTTQDEWQTLPNGMRVRGDLTKLLDRSPGQSAQHQHEEELILHLLMEAA